MISFMNRHDSQGEIVTNVTPHLYVPVSIYSLWFHMEVSVNGGYPKMVGLFGKSHQIFMENPVKNPILGNLHMKTAESPFFRVTSGDRQVVPVRDIFGNPKWFRDPKGHWDAFSVRSSYYQGP